MTDFVQQDLRGARFREVDLRDARLHRVDLTGARITGSRLVDVEITGDLENVLVNGIDVASLVEAELDRRHPDRVKMRATSVEEFREAWDLLQSLWRGTIERARGLPEERVHERVNGDWSFVERVRHLLFVTDAWVVRALLGHTEPWHPLDLPPDGLDDVHGIPRDREVRPSLDEVLDVLADRRATVQLLLENLTEEQLDGTTSPVAEPGYPVPGSYPVREVLRTVLQEEWQHRLQAERDLEILSHDAA